MTCFDVFAPGQAVRVQDMLGQKRWTDTGIILSQLPSKDSYMVRLNNGTELRHHRKHLRVEEVAGAVTTPVVAGVPSPRTERSGGHGPAVSDQVTQAMTARAGRLAMPSAVSTGSAG